MTYRYNKEVSARESRGARAVRVVVCVRTGGNAPPREPQRLLAQQWGQWRQRSPREQALSIRALFFEE